MGGNAVTRVLQVAESFRLYLGAPFLKRRTQLQKLLRRRIDQNAVELVKRVQMQSLKAIFSDLLPIHMFLNFIQDIKNNKATSSKCKTNSCKFQLLIDEKYTCRLDRFDISRTGRLRSR